MTNNFEEIYELNSKFKHAIFFTPPFYASARRNYEAKNSCQYEETINNVHFYADCIISCSCKNVYHYQHYKINNVGCNITKFRNILQKVQNKVNLAKKDRIKFNISYETI